MQVVAVLVNTTHAQSVEDGIKASIGGYKLFVQYRDNGNTAIYALTNDDYNAIFNELPKTNLNHLWDCSTGYIVF